MNAEDCVEGKSRRFVVRLHLEAVRLATLAGGLLMLSLVHKLVCLELGVVAQVVAIQKEAISYSGDSGRSSLHGVAECVHPEVSHGHFARAFAAGLRCVGHAVVSGLDETAGKIAEGEPEAAEWSFAVSDHQRVSNTC